MTQISSVDKPTRLEWDNPDLRMDVVNEVVFRRYACCIYQLAQMVVEDLRRRVVQAESSRVVGDEYEG